MLAAAELPALTVEPGYDGLLSFAEAIGRPLAEHQVVMAAAMFDRERQTVCVVPRGAGKTFVCAVVALHHLLTVPDASVSLAASTRELASIAYAEMRRLSEHPLLEGRVEARAVAAARGAMRVPGGGVLRVLSGNGARAVGQTDSLMILDEAFNLRDSTLLDALETSMVKRADARLVIVSTPAPNLDSPLGALRRRALAGDVTREGAFLDARAPGLRYVGWEVGEGVELTAEEAKKANPAPWITVEALAEARERVTPGAWATFHCGRWGAAEGSWLPPLAWQACLSTYTVADGERVVLGVDIGGSRAASAVIAVTPDLRIAHVGIFNGDRSVLAAAAAVRDLAARFDVIELAYDPWRFRSEALRLEDEGLTCVEFMQSASRMVPASEQLYAAIVEKRLRHPGDPELDRHIAAAVASSTGRGWRLDKASADAQVDAAIALAMAVSRCDVPAPRPVRFLGWL